jgi:hypothetical protein
MEQPRLQKDVPVHVSAAPPQILVRLERICGDDSYEQRPKPPGHDANQSQLSRYEPEAAE